jgi:hypothetical protein
MSQKSKHLIERAPLLGGMPLPDDVMHGGIDWYPAPKLVSKELLDIVLALRAQGFDDHAIADQIRVTGHPVTYGAVRRTLARLSNTTTQNAQPSGKTTAGTPARQSTAGKNARHPHKCHTSTKRTRQRRQAKQRSR